MTTLLAVPNISEGRDPDLIEAIARAFGEPRLGVHADPDHNRAVVTIAGEPGGLAEAVLEGARAAVERLDIHAHEGVHPRVGVVDVAPIVYLEESDRGAAAAEALVLGDLLGERLEVPVFLYGALGGGRTRAELRRGGPDRLAERIANRELQPDFGPPHLHPTAGAVLVAARAPLLAFNVELAPPATLEDVRAIAARVREGGPEGLPGVRALGLWLEQRQRAQVSFNVEDHRAVPLAQVIQRVSEHGQIVEAELVGLAPAAAFAGFPDEIPVRYRSTIEEALSSDTHGTDQAQAPHEAPGNPCRDDRDAR